MIKTNLDINEITYSSSEEKYLEGLFIKQGYLIFDVEDKEVLDTIRNTIIANIARYLNLPDSPLFTSSILDQIHESVSIQQLNQFRLSMITELNKKPWFGPAYYKLSEKMLQKIVGNELAMQRSLGLSIQLPKDTSSLLNIHADSWSGDSPFEAVVWLPLVDCYSTKSFFILNPEASKKVSRDFHAYSKLTNQEFFNLIKDQVDFINIKYGQALIFNQNLPHGNIVNQTSETRWSLNCRFKSLFSPYADKKIGEFFMPIRICPMTRVGMNYKYPEVDH